MVTTSCSLVLVCPRHSVVTRIYLRCHQQRPEAFRESRPSLSIITLVIIFTILFFNFFVKLCGELHQNVTQQSHKKLNCCCFEKIQCLKKFDLLKLVNRVFHTHTINTGDRNLVFNLISKRSQLEIPSGCFLSPYF